MSIDNDDALFIARERRARELEEQAQIEKLREMESHRLVKQREVIDSRNHILREELAERERIRAEEDERTAQRQRRVDEAIAHTKRQWVLDELAFVEPAETHPATDSFIKVYIDNTIKARSVRLFVSSTFRDMQHEREQLVKHVFPDIRRSCSDRGVHFTEVDLRWGITAEESSNGEVLTTCMDEIDNCRPYFVCILGERYGWAQPADESDALLHKTFAKAMKRHPWLRHYKDRSITEIEILYGALFWPQHCASRAFFYMRDPDTLKSLPPSELRHYVSERKEHRDRLADLKQRIKRSGLPLRTFSSKEQLGEMIRADMVAAVEYDFPEAIGADISPLTRARLVHQAFADSRSAVHVPRMEHYEALAKHVEDRSEEPLVITGESGAGKSALMANYYKRVMDTEKDNFTAVVAYFIGCTNDSNTPTDVLRFIMAELQAVLPALDRAIPEDPVEVEDEFSIWLHAANSAGSPILLLIDAVDETDTTGHQKGFDLSWLPRVFPPFVRVVISCKTTPESSVALSKKEWKKMLTVGDLDGTQRHKFVADHLSLYSKKLSSAQTQRIVEAPQTGNGLFLHCLLEELRVFGDYEALDAHIEACLQANDIPTLFDRIFSRWESDFEAVNKGIVQQFMSLIWASRHGLSERELLSVLDIQDRSSWSALFLTAQDVLTNRQGLLTFFHSHVRQAVRRRYLRTDQEQRRAHATLARLFESAARGAEARGLKEYPWQLSKMGDTNTLEQYLADVTILEAMYARQEDRHDLFSYWRAGGGTWMDRCSALYTHSIAEYERKKSPSSDRMVTVLHVVGSLMHDIGAYNGARSPLERALECAQSVYGNSHLKVAEACYNLATLLEKLGDYSDGQKLAERSLALREDRLGAQDVLTAESVCLVAHFFKKRACYEDARRLYQNGVRLLEGCLGAHHSKTTAQLHALGDVYRKLGAWKEAKTLYARVLELAVRTCGEEHPQVAGALNSIGLIEKKQGNYTAAKDLLRRALGIMEKALGSDHPKYVEISTNLGDVHRKLGEWDAAREIYQNVLASMTDVLGASHPDVAEARNNLGMVAKKTGDYRGAAQHYAAALRILEDTLGGSHPKCALILQNIGDNERKQKNYSEARTCYERARNINDTMGVEIEAGENINAIGRLAMEMGNHTEANENLMLAQKITQRCFGETHPKYAQVLNDLGVLAVAQGRTDLGKQRHQQALRINEEHFGRRHPEVGETLHYLAIVARKEKDFETARGLTEEALSIIGDTLGSNHPKYRSIARQ